MSLEFCDLGMQPLANHFLTEKELAQGEVFYPLKVVVCESCWLVQLEHPVPRERMFSDYAYFSGQSDHWVQHCREFAAEMVERFQPKSVIEIASNDGTLLKQFHALRVPAVLGVEPSYNLAKHAGWHGAPTLAAYWGKHTAGTVESADLIVAMNVLAHVPDLDDFIGGIADALAPDGVVVFEFPWLWRLIERGDWDTIYHEHHSYLSLTAVSDLLRRRGLYICDASEVTTHGGSLRVIASTVPTTTMDSAEKRIKLLAFEASIGLDKPPIYQAFAGLPAMEREAARSRLCGKQITTIGYGAAAKGVTFLNYCGIGRETVSHIIDSTPAKQGKFAPGTHIPIVPPESLRYLRPSRIIVLPWNWRDEIEAKIHAQCDWYPEIVSRPFHMERARLAA